MNKIVSICGDPGGAAAVAPVLLRLAGDDSYDLHNFAYFRAPQVFGSRGVPFHELPNESSSAAIKQLFDRKQPDLLFCGTSMNGWDLERDFLVEASQRKIPSVAVLDFWTNYRARFRDSRSPETPMPTRIAIMDEQARAEMIAEGFEPENLVMTGQPAFDELACWRSEISSAKRGNWRRQAGVGENDLFVVFVSQPVFGADGGETSALSSRGYDEHTVASALLRALEEVAGQSGRPVSLLIRPHPREDVAKYGYLKSDRVRIEVTATGNARETIVAADLVAGINSVLLVEACYLGCLVVSIQPNLKTSDPLPTNRLGFSRAVYAEQEIATAVKEWLLDDAVRRVAMEKLTRFHPAGGAADRIAALVHSLLSRSSPISI